MTLIKHYICQYQGFVSLILKKKDYFIIYYFAVCAKLYHVLHLHNGTQ